MAIWPFADVDPLDGDFETIQQLALRRVLGLNASETEFLPDQPASQDWVDRVVATVDERGYRLTKSIELPLTRRELAKQIWAEIERQPVPKSFFEKAIAWKVDPTRDGVPDHELSNEQKAFNFTSHNALGLEGWSKDSGQ